MPVNEVINASNSDKWDVKLALFKNVSPCYLAHYHLAYCTRIPGVEALMFSSNYQGEIFCYPFLLYPIDIPGFSVNKSNSYYDIASVYGYSGPLVTTKDKKICKEFWSQFNCWAQQKNIVAELTRFCPLLDNHEYAMPDTIISSNRKVAVCEYGESFADYTGCLPTKTRNMLRDNKISGLELRLLNFNEHLGLFRKIYQETMEINQAQKFFYYNDAYYRYMALLAKQKNLELFGVFENNTLKAMAMVLIKGNLALYHLSCTCSSTSNASIGNFLLWKIGWELFQRGIKLFNLGGGRTVKTDDSLFRYKKNNASATRDYIIGKRIFLPKIYQSIVDHFEKSLKHKIDKNYLFFYHESLGNRL